MSRPTRWVIWSNELDREGELDRREVANFEGPTVLKAITEMVGQGRFCEGDVIRMVEPEASDD